jgi:MFS family permease
MGAFAAWEGRAPEPMLPPRLFRNRPFVAANTTGFLMIAALFGAAFLVAQYFQFVLGNSPLQAGVHTLPWTAGVLVIAPLAGKLSDRIGPRPLMAAGMLLQTIGLGWFAVTAGIGTSYGSLVLPLTVAGIGISMSIPTTAAAALGSVKPIEMGKASGANSTMQRFGAVFGIAIVTVVFASSGHLGTPAGFNAGFAPALAVAACLSLLGTLAALAVEPRRDRAQMPNTRPGAQLAEAQA